MGHEISGLSCVHPWWYCSSRVSYTVCTTGRDGLYRIFFPLSHLYLNHIEKSSLNAPIKCNPRPSMLNANIVKHQEQKICKYIKKNRYESNLLIWLNVWWRCQWHYMTNMCSAWEHCRMSQRCQWWRGQLVRAGRQMRRDAECLYLELMQWWATSPASILF